MDWPAYSPDLNPIEHVWDMLDRRIEARQPPPTCPPEIRRALLDEWCNIPQDQIDNWILSMPRRFEKLSILNCIFVNGKTTIRWKIFGGNYPINSLSNGCEPGMRKSEKDGKMSPSIPPPSPKLPALCFR
ncbi:RNase H domain-containing protein [Trichonephila clavipes]|nr:RNase H domain-containing protein [Trichonephila clavipes]